MDDKKIVELKTDQNKHKQEQKPQKNVFADGMQTNPILQKMLCINEASQKMKFKLKDLFR